MSSVPTTCACTFTLLEHDFVINYNNTLRYFESQTFFILTFHFLALTFLHHVFFHFLYFIDFQS